MSRRVRLSAVRAPVLSGLVVRFVGNCGNDSPSSPPPVVAPTPAPSSTPVPGAITITSINGSNSFLWSPASARVGQQVVKHNADSTTHTAIQNGGGFDTGSIPPGGTSSPITLTTPGTIGCHWAIHPSMVGTLMVTP